MKERAESLELFHPLIRRWFRDRKGEPTQAQAEAWPLIAGGDHVLVSSPTGSGKTLCAFLWALDRLVTGVWVPGGVRVLYVSPLKALNNDVRENLLRPLAEIRGLFRGEGMPVPEVGVSTRSGDTPQNERARMLRRPPEILITTPESLNILLTTKRGRDMLGGITTVILDEIHALAGNKRGTHCITAVERLVPLAGEFQRIALSATVRPLEEVAAFVGGYRHEGGSYCARGVRTVEAGGEKRYAVSVAFPEDARDRIEDGTWWPAVIDLCRREIASHRSTLIFVNSRRLAEKVSHLINEQEGERISWPHHGSLSRELRFAVEGRLKRGELKCIVATNSLELGIDVGDLESVILLQSPFSVSGALQRIGRSGHGVGETSRGLIVPLFGRDFADAAVLAKGVAEREIESVRAVRNPLDLLAQIIVSMTLDGPCGIDLLYDLVRCAHPYRDLPRRHYDLVLEMLAGRYSGTRIRDLQGLVTLDLIDGTVAARRGARYLLYSSGGTIPERGYYALRVEGSLARIGELDEEFVFERSIGDTFALGSGSWRIRDVTAGDVIVAPTAASPGIIPFWKNEAQDRGFHLSERIGLFLEETAGLLGSPSLPGMLEERYFMEESAAAELVRLLSLQFQATGSIPHRHNLLVEHCAAPADRDLPGSGEESQVILHCLWGGRVNRPLAMALGAAWKQRYGHRLETFTGNDAMLMMLPQGFRFRELLDLLKPEDLRPLLRSALEETAYFGARFRENAGRALLLPKTGISRRYPFWLNRLRSKKLLDAVAPLPDFPILLETWRTCLQDEFDLAHAEQVLREVESGEILVTERTTGAPSPFASGIVYRQVEKYMYEDDRPVSGPSRLSDNLIREVALDGALRPAIEKETIAGLEGRLHRTMPGYAPDSPEELLRLLRDRLLVPRDEWLTLLEAVRRDYGDDAAITAGIADRAAMIRLPGAPLTAACALESLPALSLTLGVSSQEIQVLSLWGEIPARREDIAIIRLETAPPPLEALAAQWLGFYGPVAPSRIRDIFGLSGDRMEELASALTASEEVVFDRVSREAASPELCDRRNLETLLRMARRSRQPRLAARPAPELHPFLASLHRLNRAGGPQGIEEALERLFGYPARAGLWEEAFLPARIPRYQASQLDSLFQETELQWIGCGAKRITLALRGDMDLFRPDNDAGGDNPASPLLPLLDRSTTFLELVSKSGLPSDRVSRELWELAWSGIAHNDTFSVVRKGLMSRFAPPETGAAATGRRGYDRWRSTRPIPGNWRTVDYGGLSGDEFEMEEARKDRVRILMRRYGILFRELLEREAPPLQWSELFRSMRLMELSGELVAGHFFEGTRGIQFLSAEGLRHLHAGFEPGAVYWMNACDPASLCGSGIGGLPESLPSRLPSNWIVFRGCEAVMVCRRDCRDLTILLEPGDGSLHECMSLFTALTGRDFSPFNRILVETVNGGPATQSPYAPALAAFGFRKTYAGLEIQRRFGGI
ncbi:MAG: DEAD/DEAH box helicase [Spirochaetes bacterium]|nr:DEAD/DEAH box helicase [Spirochaetota bacterium]